MSAGGTLLVTVPCCKLGDKTKHFTTQRQPKGTTDTKPTSSVVLGKLLFAIKSFLVGYLMRKLIPPPLLLLKKMNSNILTYILSRGMDNFKK